jgi:hypothetical protein
MKDTITKKVQDYLEKIEDFARAITLDEANVSAGGIALTMADEIMSYSARAYDLLEGEID